LYRLNLENPVVKELRALNFQIARNMAEVATGHIEPTIKKVSASSGVGVPA